MQELFQLFQTLVSIDSPSGEEKKVSDYVVQYLEELGLRPVQNKDFSIYCRAGKGKNPVLFCQHLDTVEPGRNIKVVEKDGYFMSDGSTILGGDNKVGVAALLYSLKQAIKKGKKLNVELLFSVQEELGSCLHTYEFSQLSSKLGFVFDLGGSEDLSRVVVQGSTIMDCILELRGKSSHASRPENGKNALTGLLRLQDSLPLGRVDEETTFNLGLIRGGEVANTVPDSIILRGDLRSSDHSLVIQYQNSIEENVHKKLEGTGVTAHFTWEPYMYAYKLDTTDSDFLSLARTYKDASLDLKPVETQSGSDAGPLNRAGIKTYCLGYGVLDAHTTRERVSKQTIRKLAEVMELVVTKWF